MTKKITSLLIVATFISAIAVAQNFSALYTFDSVKTNSGLTDVSPLPVVEGVVLDSFSAIGSAFVNPNATARFSFTDWSNGATNGENAYDSLNGNIDLAQYYEVALAPNAGYTLDLSSITFSVQRSGTGIRTYSVRSSIDGYSANLPASIAPANTNLSVQTGDVFFWNFDALSNNQNGSTITLDPQNFSGLTAPVTFRFYAWNAEGSSGTFSIDNVTINGTANSTTLAYFTANSVCENDSLHFVDLSTSLSNIVSWSWNFGGASPPVTVQNPVHYFPVGAHPVTLTVTNDSAYTNSYTDTVYVYPNPQAAWATLNSGIGPCAGDAVIFSDLSTVSTGTIATYEWNFGDIASGTNDTSSLSSPSHQYTNATTYNVTQIVTTDMGCKDTSVTPITVASHPVAAYTYDATTGTTVSFTDASTGGATWYWDFDANSTNDNANTQNPFYTYPESGIYTACLIVTGTTGCMDTICQSVASSDVGVAETELQNAVQIYPSPSNDGLFTIDVTNLNLNTAKANVHNLIGKVVYSQHLQNNNKNTIDLSTMNNGIYFINIIGDNDTFTKRVIINK